MNDTKRKMRGTNHVSPEIRRTELLNAAIKCFSASGYTATTIDHIAKQAGLSKGSIYRFFKSKDDVLLAMLDKYDNDIDKLLLENLSTLEDPLEILRLMIRVTLEYFSKQHGMERVWPEFQYQPCASEKYKIMYDEARIMVEEVIQVGIDSGRFYEHPIQSITDTIFAFHEGLIDISIFDNDFDMLKRFDEAWPIIARGIIS
ncbi:MAG: TetR/AcrR family transcriptional regulator [Cocleimonas sp.]|jgi:TetR/AcrR family transcriptional regulator